VVHRPITKYVWGNVYNSIDSKMLFSVKKRLFVELVTLSLFEYSDIDAPAIMKYDSFPITPLFLLVVLSSFAYAGVPGLITDSLATHSHQAQNQSRADSFLRHNTN